MSQAQIQPQLQQPLGYLDSSLQQHQPSLPLQPTQPLQDHSLPKLSGMASDQRPSPSALSNHSSTDIEDSFSDLDSLHDNASSPSASNQSSRTTSPGGYIGSSKKHRSSGLRLSLKGFRTPKLVNVAPTDEHALDSHHPRRSLDGPRISVDRNASLDPLSLEGRASFDGIDLRRREKLLGSPTQLTHSASKTATRFSLTNSPTPTTPTMVRPTHLRSNTTPTGSPTPSSYGTSPRRTAASPSPQPVKETHTMMKDYDPLTGNKMINKYMVVRELGRGVHGKVKLCRDTLTDELCAIKIVDKTTRKRLGRAQLSNEQKIRREIAIMKKCIHPNVVRLIEVIDDPNARKIYLVLEFMEGGEVHWKDAEERPILPLDDARTIFRDVVLGLEYLHIQGIIHRDIKPANLLLSGDGTVKISDFGVSHFSEKHSLDHDLDSSPLIDKDLPALPSSANPFENIFRHSVHAPFSSSISGSGPTTFNPDNYHQQHLSTTQWGDDLELAKTAGSPAFFAPELCYANELSPILSPALSSASQTSFILSPPTPRSNPTTPTGTLSTGSGQGYAPRPPITKSIDIWALGVTLYCFIYGCCPFVAETEFELFNIISRKQPGYPDSVPGREYICPEIKDLLSKLLEKDVSKRISLKEVKEHPWVTQDLEDPEVWRTETDPCNYQRVQITDDDLKGAVTIIDKIKSRIRKLSVSLSNFTLGRRRSKSITSSHTPESPTGSVSPVPIIRSPVATISQTTTHATAQPQTYSSQISLPERFQHFHSYSNGSGSTTLVPGRQERPNSVCSNVSSIGELDEGQESRGSGGRNLLPSHHPRDNGSLTGYPGRRRLFRKSLQHNVSEGGLEHGSGSKSRLGSASMLSSRRSYSDVQIDQRKSGTEASCPEQQSEV